MTVGETKLHRVCAEQLIANDKVKKSVMSNEKYCVEIILRKSPRDRLTPIQVGQLEEAAAVDMR